MCGHLHNHHRLHGVAVCSENVDSRLNNLDIPADKLYIATHRLYEVFCYQTVLTPGCVALELVSMWQGLKSCLASWQHSLEILYLPGKMRDLQT